MKSWVARCTRRAEKVGWASDCHWFLVSIYLSFVVSYASRRVEVRARDLRHSDDKNELLRRAINYEHTDNPTQVVAVARFCGVSEAARCQKPPPLTYILPSRLTGEYMHSDQSFLNLLFPR